MLLIECTGLRKKRSKSHKLYIEASQKIKKWIGILDMACLKITPMLSLLPPLILGFSNYFMTDLGDEAFELQAPIW